MDFCGILDGIRGQSTNVASSHMVAGRPCRSADWRFNHIGSGNAEVRWLWIPSF